MKVPSDSGWRTRSGDSVNEPSAAGGAVTAAEIIRNFGFWQQRALVQPLTITHHGRARVMLISTEAYEQLQDAGKADDRDQEPDLLIENLKEGLVLHDSELRIAKMNRAAEAFFGANREDLAAFSSGDTKGTEHPSAMQGVLQRVLRSGEILDYEADSGLPSGRRISLRSFPYRGGVATLFLNLTEQERLRQAAAEAEAARKVIAAMGKVGLGRVSIAGNLVAADEVFQRLAGLPVPELLSVPLIAMVAEGDRARVRALYDAARLEGRTGGVVVNMGGVDAHRKVNIAFAPVMRDVQIDGVVLAVSEV